MRARRIASSAGATAGRASSLGGGAARLSGVRFPMRRNVGPGPLRVWHRERSPPSRAVDAGTDSVGGNEAAPKHPAKREDSFQRFPRGRGHGYRGRCESLPLRERRPLLGLTGRVRLNPVRAALRGGFVEGPRVVELPELLEAQSRRTGFARHRGLASRLGRRPFGFADARLSKPPGALCEEGDPRKPEGLLKRYCRGGSAGSAKAEHELAKDPAEETPEADRRTADPKEVNEAQWEPVSGSEMAGAGKPGSGVERGREGAVCKAAVFPQTPAEGNRRRQSADRPPPAHGKSEPRRRPDPRMKNLYPVRSTPFCCPRPLFVALFGRTVPARPRMAPFGRGRPGVMAARHASAWPGASRRAPRSAAKRSISARAERSNSR